MDQPGKVDERRKTRTKMHVTRIYPAYEQHIENFFLSMDRLFYFKEGDFLFVYL